MPPEQLVDEADAAYWTGRPASTIRRWAAEGRIRRHAGARRPNGRAGVLYSLDDLPPAQRDPDTRELLTPGDTPPAPEAHRHAA